MVTKPIHRWARMLHFKKKKSMAITKISKHFIHVFVWEVSVVLWPWVSNEQQCSAPAPKSSPSFCTLRGGM